jgi:2-dehydro-3-deoxyglucarate aldolase
MKLKEKLQNNQLTIGSWVTIGHQSIIEIMAGAGFDWLTIDLEHSAIDISTCQNLIAHIQSNRICSLVRVGKNEEVIIKRVMDAGADGVIVPMVNSAAHAKKAVDFVKYPPTGKRGVGLGRAQKYGIGFDGYKVWLENEAVVIAQIEHIEAVKNINEILQAQGIDGIIIGPYDLSGSMGIPGNYECMEVQDAIQTVKAACQHHNKPLGFHVIQPEKEKLIEKINAGYTFLAFSIDFLFLGNKARSEMSEIRRNIL